MTTPALTWYGGYIGVRWNADTALHLLRDDGKTFCGIASGLRQATSRECGAWCHTCNDRAQTARRPVRRRGRSPQTGDAV